MQFAAGLLLSIALAGITPAVLAAPSDLEGRQSDAEKQQGALRERIEALQKAIDTRESVRKEAADALRASEPSISGINRRLRELATDSRQAQTDLSSLERQISAQQVALDKRRSELADQLRTQYASGLSPWAALLSGNDPQELGRNLSYLDYVSQARARNVEVLRKDIDRLAALQERADGRRVELEKVVAEITEQKNSLLVQQKERATLLAQLEGQIAAQRAEAGKLGRDDQRLSRLIDDLDVAIAKQAEAARKAEQERQAALAAQRKAEEARKIEDARLALAARKRAEAERQKAELAARRLRDEADAAQARAQVEAAARQAQGPVVLADPDAAGLRPLAPGQNSLIGGQQVKEATPPPEDSGKAAQSSKAIEEEAEQTRSRAGAEPPPRPVVNTGNGLRHGLPMPVRGAVQGRFGVDRPDGGVWRGIVLRTAEGTPVKAVAPGAVVYSDWLRGFGNLIIVDHGQQYLTVYAYNQSLIKRVGDPVATGDIIATVGATGGQVESGLYFEIRHRGAPVDPALWLAQ